MPELLRHATDDQIALAFCFAGVFVSGMIMYFSYHVGQITQAQKRPAAEQPQPQVAVRRDKAA